MASAILLFTVMERDQQHTTYLLKYTVRVKVRKC